MQRFNAHKKNTRKVFFFHFGHWCFEDTLFKLMEKPKGRTQVKTLKWSSRNARGILRRIGQAELPKKVKGFSMSSAFPFEEWTQQKIPAGNLVHYIYLTAHCRKKSNIWWSSITAQLTHISAIPALLTMSQASVCPTQCAETFISTPLGRPMYYLCGVRNDLCSFQQPVSRFDSACAPVACMSRMFKMQPSFQGWHRDSKLQRYICH